MKQLEVILCSVFDYVSMAEHMVQLMDGLFYFSLTLEYCYSVEHLPLPLPEEVVWRQALDSQDFYFDVAVDTMLDLDDV